VVAETVEDLATREGTSARNIGSLCRTGEASCRDRASRDAIRAWAAVQDMDAVVWTDLPSNFAEKRRQPFSVAAALAYLRKLDPERRAKALEYIRRAPPFVRTPLRDALGES